VVAVVTAVAFVAFGACGDFKQAPAGSDAGASSGASGSGGSGSSASSASSSGGSSTSSSSSGGSSSSGASGSGGPGPGPFGALPNGYCCTTNDDCRFRNCADTPSGKMCIESCQTADGCLQRAGAFTCVGGTFNGKCTPAAGITCIPANQFDRGAKDLGSCCTATHDANAGLECQGGHCASFGDVKNPYLCTQVCKKPADCPGAYDCLNAGDYNICVPSAPTYACK
jgi:hypothetical protein